MKDLIVKNLFDLSEEARDQAARLLVEGFKEMAPNAWPDPSSARVDIDELMEDDENIMIAAFDSQNRMVGWIGAQPSHGPQGWELHPLVVDPLVQKKGIGRKLVEELEHRVVARGAVMMWLGTDDEAGWTSLAGVDLFPEPLEKLTNLQDREGHPFAFYRRLGYAVVGVLPDANGFGKPDILMAKRLQVFKANRRI